MTPQSRQLRAQALALLAQARALEQKEYRRQVVELQAEFDRWHTAHPRAAMQDWPAWEYYLDIERMAGI